MSKGILKQITGVDKNDNPVLEELLPKTSADIVTVDNGSGEYPGTSTDAQAALKEVYNLANIGGNLSTKIGLIEINTANAVTLTDAQYAEAQKKYCILRITNSTGTTNYYKYNEVTTSNRIYFRSFEDLINGNYVTISYYKYFYYISTSNGVHTLSTRQSQSYGTWYSKDGVDGEINTVKGMIPSSSAYQAPITDNNLIQIFGTDSTTGKYYIYQALKQNSGAVTVRDDSSYTKQLLGEATKADIVTVLANYSASDDDKTRVPSVMAVKNALGNYVAGTKVESIGANPSNSNIPTEAAVSSAITTAINGLPSPMQFKGSIGSGGTIDWSSLPGASTHTGYTYKVITAHNTTPICAVGDTIISDGANWIVIPSGDEPSGTVTSVGGAAASGSHLSVSGSPITSSGTLTVGVESGYSIPSTTDQSSWSGKYAKPSGGIPSSDMTSAVQVSLGKADTAVQTLSATGDATGTMTKSNGAGTIALTLANSGVGTGWGENQTSANYSAVTVDAKGRVTAGGKIFEKDSGTHTPSSDLAVGGLFFELLS